jgi:hypothetical protein
VTWTDPWLAAKNLHHATMSRMRLETTTIYTKVATMSHRRIQSPLDVLKQPKNISPLRASIAPWDE